MPVASGTRILTANGDVPVEALREGAAVETASGAFQPVVFVGRRLVDIARHNTPRDVSPARAGRRFRR